MHRQSGGEVRAEVGRHRRAEPRDDVAHQPFAFGTGVGRDRRSGDAGVGEQRGFDLGWLDPVAAHLELGVDAPEEFERAVTDPARPIAGAVDRDPALR